MKHAILFLSDKSSQWVINNFNSIFSVESVSFDVCFLYHKRGLVLPDAIESLNHFCFTSGVLYELGYKSLGEELLPGNNHFPLLKFYLENRQYDYYWMIEDDVYFTGDWGKLFRFYENERIDFISTHIKKYTEAPQWIWWNTLNTNQESIPDGHKVCSFNPIYRLSNKALECIDRTLKEGWSGHHEVLIPSLLLNKRYSIADMGGTGSFVKTGSENRFYTKDTMSHLPLELGTRTDCLYHPVKEKKVIDLKRLKKNCVISAVGKDSLHREWMKENPDFDLHLIIYDNSYNKFYNDTDFITYQKGYKFKLIYNYLQDHPEYLERYDYFFMPDDDILIDTVNISKLFRRMQEWNLQIAQPALSGSYYTYEHTLRDRFCALRYTNFVEMMLPCFSRKALKKILMTFTEGRIGWGIEFHWSQLIGFKDHEMAIIDELKAVHTRPIQSYNRQNADELDGYVKRNNLSREIVETNFIPVNLQFGDFEGLITDRTVHTVLTKRTGSIAEYFLQTIQNSIRFPTGFDGLTGVSLFLANYYCISEKRRYLDKSLSIVKWMNGRVIWIKRDTSFEKGLPGFSWYVEYLAQHGFIKNKTDEALIDICRYFNNYQLDHVAPFDAILLTGIARHYLERMANPHFDISKEFNQIEKERLIKIICKIHDWCNLFLVSGEGVVNLKNVIDCILLLCQAKRFLDLPELDWTLSTMADRLEDSFSDVPYLLKSYLLILSSKSLGNKILWDRIIRDVSNYINRMENMPSQQLLNLYLLHRIYLLTRKEVFRMKSLEILHSFMDGWDNELLGFNEDPVKIDKLIHSGLILTSLLSDKDLELDNCILMSGK